MFRSFRLGRLFGFPIHVNVTFLVLLAVVGLTMGGIGAIGFVLLSFASVVLHELGHALVARHLGVGISRIELHFFGGAAQMTDQPRRAGDEIAIAAAGPAVSFALAGLSVLLAGATGLGLFHSLAWINLFLGAFNLIPALPMDGGRILRAVLSRRMGFLRATETSATVARVFAIGLGLLGIVSTQLYLVVLAVVLWLMTSAEVGAARLGRIGFREEARPVPPGGPAPFASFDPFDRFGRDGELQRDRGPRGWFGGRRTGFVVHREGGRLIIERLD